MTAEDSYEILIGTYEEFVLGYQLIKAEDGETKYSLTQTFVTHSHQASVRSIAATSKLAASSGADETVVLYDMVKRKQSGALMQHEGTITCLKFTPEGSHLISCSDDGSIAIFRVGSWQLEKLFKKAHKGTSVNYLAIHPSGKLALSVGKDKTLRTWNLIKGRSAYITNLSSYGVAFENLDYVVWSPEGMMYALPIQSKAVVFSVEKAGVVHTLTSTCKVHTVCFLNETTLCIGNEESSITCYNLSDGSQLWTMKASGSRVKGLAVQQSHLVAITSAGDLVVWEFDTSDVAREPTRIAATNDGCRFTCLTIRPPIVSDDPNTTPIQTKKKKRKSITNTTSASEDSKGESVTLSSKPDEDTNKNNEEIEVINVPISEGVRRKKTKANGIEKIDKNKKNATKGKVNKDDDEEEERINNTKKDLKRKSSQQISNEKSSGVKKSKKVSELKEKTPSKGKGVQDEFVDISAPLSLKKKKVDHSKMVAKKSKRQGKVGKGLG